MGTSFDHIVTKILIKIEDSHSADGESHSSELLTTGFLLGEDNGYTIMYYEKDEDLKRCPITITVEGDKRITMLRTGAYSSELVIEKGRRRDCHYVTPYGELVMDVLASSIISDIKPTGGRLEFRYSISMNSGFVSDNHLKITVKEAKNDAAFN